MTCNFWKIIVEVQQNNFNDIREHKVLVKDHLHLIPFGVAVWLTISSRIHVVGTYPWHGLFPIFRIFSQGFHSWELYLLPQSGLYSDVAII